MRALLKSVLAQTGLPELLKINLGACLLIFLLLQIWRPCYFLTDDNLSGAYPVFIEMGRHMQHGEWPFVSDYLFGGHYDWSRDMSCLSWHPFIFLPMLLADTFAKFWIIDVIALLFLLGTTTGFTLLAHRLREEFTPGTPNLLLAFYTMSFVFSFYILMIGPSWYCFLGNQCALPWLALGILNRKMIRGTIIVTIAGILQFVGSYAAMTISNSLLLSVFALGVCLVRRSPRPFIIWYGGNLFVIFFLCPFLLHLIDGFSHCLRIGGYSVENSMVFSANAGDVPFDLLFGSWSQILLRLEGDSALAGFTFPYISSLFACAAAWCLLPALVNSSRWQPMQILFLGMALFTLVFVVRPYALAVVLQSLPVVKATRWPFREILQFLFFFHLFLILRPPSLSGNLRWVAPLFSLAMFAIPLPFISAPTFNLVGIDREAVFSGNGQLFWNRVKPLLQPGDQLATVIDWRLWNMYLSDIPYSYLGTANYPALYQIPNVGGYSTTAPLDQVIVKTVPSFWFGAYDSSQVAALWHENPKLKLIVVEHVHPLKIVLQSKGRPDVDLSSYLPPSLEK